jgi:transposase-like protein
VGATYTSDQSTVFPGISSLDCCPYIAPGNNTINELASQFGVHPTLIQDWKKHLLAGAEQVFSNGLQADTTAQAEAQKPELFEQIGRLQMELEWLKKKVGPLC